MTLSGAKYEYEQRLGGGGMAEVFLARTVGAEGFTRPVAIKRVLPAYSDDAQFAAMFINEAKLSARIAHPNVVQVLDFDRDRDGRLYLVMELVPGKDLSDVIAAGGPLPVSVVVYVTVEVLKGLAHAHELRDEHGRPLGIVHRDISPHNVLVSWDGGVKVSDFGIAKAMFATSSRSGMIKGKPLYMAPEQVTSPEGIDHRADLFAVGVMLYEMLTGQRLYRGTTNEEVLTDIVQVAHGLRQMTAPSALRAGVPADVSQATMRLLSPDRAHRFGSAREAIDALLATTSATPRGAELLAAELAIRFPDQAPAREVRRASAASGGIPAAPHQGTWVVTPAPGAVAVGTPAPPATTRTLPMPSTGSAAAVAATLAPTRRRGVLAVVTAAVVLGAAVIAVLATRGSGEQGGAAAPAVAPVDAATPAGAAIAIDAAPPVEVERDAAAAVDAGVEVVVAPDAAAEAPPAPTKKTRPPRRDPKDRERDSTIHEIELPGE